MSKFEVGDRVICTDPNPVCEDEEGQILLEGKQYVVATVSKNSYGADIIAVEGRREHRYRLLPSRFKLKEE